MRDTGDAAALAERIGVLRDDAHHLAEPEGDDGEIVAAKAQRRRPERHPGAVAITIAG